MTTIRAMLLRTGSVFSLSVGYATLAAGLLLEDCTAKKEGGEWERRFKS